MKRILIVEDDKALNQGIVLALRQETYVLESVYSLQAARRAMAGRKFDLMLLDVNLPDGNGLVWLRELRRASNMPVILLTANDLETDVVTGFELGADDYITKPFSLAILRARVGAQLRDTAARAVYCFGDYAFDFDRLEFSKNGIAVELSKTEQKLLRILVENQGRTVPRGSLLDRIWTDEAEYVYENALSVAVKRLRDKLSAADRIKTVYGIGYLWVAE